jgi:hypothetical protein
MVVASAARQRNGPRRGLSNDYDGSECFKPFGNYSMCAVIRGEDDQAFYIGLWAKSREHDGRPQQRRHHQWHSDRAHHDEREIVNSGPPTC